MKFRAITENHLYSKAYAKGKKFVGLYAVVYVMPDYKSAKLKKPIPKKKR